MKPASLFLFFIFYTANAAQYATNPKQILPQQPPRQFQNQSPQQHASSVEIILERENILPTGSKPVNADLVINEILQDFQKENPSVKIPPVNFLLYQYFDKTKQNCETKQNLPQSTGPQSDAKRQAMIEYLGRLQQFLNTPVNQIQNQVLPQQPPRQVQTQIPQQPPRQVQTQIPQQPPRQVQTQIPQQPPRQVQTQIPQQPPRQVQNPQQQLLANQQPPIVPAPIPLILSNVPYRPTPVAGFTHQMKNRGHMGFRGKKDRVRGRAIGARGLAGGVTGFPHHGHLF